MRRAVLRATNDALCRPAAAAPGCISGLAHFGNLWRERAGRTLVPVTPKPKSGEGFTPARRWPRFRFDVPARVLLRRNARDLEFTGRGTAMNEGGMALDLAASLQVGNRVQVEFTPPYAWLPVRVQGLVRNVTGNRYGVEFLPADPSEQQEVALYRRMLRAAAGRLGE